MKKIICVLLSLMIMLSLAGCKNSEENTEGTTTAETTAEPTTEEIDYDNLVTDAYSGTKNNRKISIPKINLDSKEIDELNDQIWQYLYVNGVENRDEISSVNSGDYISYRWYANGDIISLIITDGTNHEIWYSYIVYNISIKDKDIIDNKTVITSAGFTMDEYYGKAKDAIGSEFFNKYGQFREEISGYEDTANDYNEALDNSLSKENIDSALPYLNENGELCIIASIYSISQMDIAVHESDLNLENFELAEGYDEKAVFGNISVQAEENNSSQQKTENISTSTEVSIEEYFGGDFDKKLISIRPLYDSAANAVIKIGDYNNSPDENVTWSVIYSVLNTFSERTPTSESVKHELGSAIKVNTNELVDLHNEIFANKITSLPALGSYYTDNEYSGISYSEEEDVYYFINATGGGYFDEFKDGYVLENGNAVLEFSVENIVGEHMGDCRIEITPDSRSRFGYTIVSAKKG